MRIRTLLRWDWVVWTREPPQTEGLYLYFRNGRVELVSIDGKAKFGDGLPMHKTLRSAAPINLPEE